jgi:hypothetical protein
MCPRTNPERMIPVTAIKILSPIDEPQRHRGRDSTFGTDRTAGLDAAVLIESLATEIRILKDRTWPRSLYLADSTRAAKSHRGRRILDPSKRTFKSKAGGLEPFHEAFTDRILLLF